VLNIGEKGKQGKFFMKSVTGQEESASGQRMRGSETHKNGCLKGEQCSKSCGIRRLGKKSVRHGGGRKKKGRNLFLGVIHPCGKEKRLRDNRYPRDCMLIMPRKPVVGTPRATLKKIFRQKFARAQNKGGA